MIRSVKNGDVFTNRCSQINIWIVWPAKDYKDKKARVVYEHLCVNKSPFSPRPPQYTRCVAQALEQEQLRSGQV